jgi:predicted lipoprotein with Yx(FWY)xxD motif
MGNQQPRRHPALRRLIVGLAIVAAATFLTGSIALAAATPSSVSIGVATSATLGRYLTAAGGLTLYTLSSDPKNKSTCAGQCVAFWPPLLITAGGTVSADPGATGRFASFTRSDVSAQVSDDGRPLYYFANDAAAGQTNGEGVVAFGGTWHVAKPMVILVSGFGVHGAARLTYDPSGRASLYLNAKALAKGPWSEALYVGSCARLSTRVVLFPLLSVGSGGAIGRTNGLNAAQARLLRGHAGVVRLAHGSSAVCGALKVVVAPTPTPPTPAPASPSLSPSPSPTSGMPPSPPPTYDPPPGYGYGP